MRIILGTLIMLLSIFIWANGIVLASLICEKSGILGYWYLSAYTVASFIIINYGINTLTKENV